MNILPFAFLFLFLFSSCNSSSKDKPNPKETEQQLTVAVSADVQTMDPRLMHNTLSTNVVHMLFEGLMYVNAYGEIMPGVAKNVSISEDGLTYTFHLKESAWSDGTPLTAEDFEYTWKSVLNPKFPAPNAYQLFVIKGAQAAKEGKGTLDAVGIKAVDPKTLVVELVQPTPYFIELTTTHFYAPVSRHWAEAKDRGSMVSNGPFKFDHVQMGKEFSVVKNPHFWNASQVKLDRITLAVMDDNTALKIFQKGGVEWVGSPMSFIPPDAIATLKMDGKLVFAPAAATTWLVINTEKPPFDQVKMRKAFNLAIDRQGLVDYVIKGSHTPATGIVPLSLLPRARPYFEDNDVPAAWTNFQNALKEAELSKDDMPAISFCYSATDRNHKIAQTLQQQWIKAFGIEVRLEPCESHVYFDRMRQKNYQIGIGSWVGDIKDPINFLEVFKSKENGTNMTRWESADFRELLSASMKVRDRVERLTLLGKAEHLLMENVPVLPLFHVSFNYVKKSDVKGVYFSELGYLDFRHAYRGE